MSKKPTGKIKLTPIKPLDGIRKASNRRMGNTLCRTYYQKGGKDKRGMGKFIDSEKV